ncbi:MAG: rRNA maturation RNase YbeY [Cognatishimia sp.]|uniref:rRNA maturation RNase YbeY n=1 Tax=Cognatishimia sp. TaxID=2211648 RepID=UPI003B8E4B12
MEIDLIIEDARWAAESLQGLAEKAGAGVRLELELAADLEVCVMACNDVWIAELNAEFREKPTPTNVLSWPSEERGAEDEGAHPVKPEGPDSELGDIAISYETCAREAIEAGKTFDDHVTHLLVHGILHLLGYDHIRDQDATLMEALESKILGKMGISDPYSETPG